MWVPGCVSILACVSRIIPHEMKQLHEGSEVSAESESPFADTLNYLQICTDEQTVLLISVQNVSVKVEEVEGFEREVEEIPGVPGLNNGKVFDLELIDSLNFTDGFDEAENISRRPKISKNDSIDFLLSNNSSDLVDRLQVRNPTYLLTKLLSNLPNNNKTSENESTISTLSHNSTHTKPQKMRVYDFVHWIPDVLKAMVESIASLGFKGARNETSGQNNNHGDQVHLSEEVLSSDLSEDENTSSNSTGNDHSSNFSTGASDHGRYLDHRINRTSVAMCLNVTISDPTQLIDQINLSLKWEIKNAEPSSTNKIVEFPTSRQRGSSIWTLVCF